MNVERLLLDRKFPFSLKSTIYVHSCKTTAENDDIIAALHCLKSSK